MILNYNGKVKFGNTEISRCNLKYIASPILSKYENINYNTVTIHKGWREKVELEAFIEPNDVSTFNGIINEINDIGGGKAVMLMSSEIQSAPIFSCDVNMCNNDIKYNEYIGGKHFNGVLLKLELENGNNRIALMDGWSNMGTYYNVLTADILIEQFIIL